MNFKIAHIFAALFSAFLLFLAIGYNGWNCNGSVFSGNCGQLEYMRTVGGLLLTAGIITCIVAILIILDLVHCASGLDIAAAATVTISTIFSAAGVFFYFNNTHVWSPFLATMAMTISFVLTALLIIDAAMGNAKSS
ncbi:expressed conserved protein [Echinococcus multilocularis]|uniref:Expressed conserved protein n=1 Tax=Echinococcus multilocularis TaxID=6211 RepID=A0A087VXV5_ECHMU|nr:expressed conserved protein [Echinococcus multilocularis]